jgi:Cu+-exporting ATPase
MNTFHARQNDAATLFGGAGPDETREGRAWLDEPDVPRLGLRLAISAVLTAQLIAIAIIGHGARVAWLELALATPIVGWVALPFYDRAVGALRRRRANMFALASLGVLTAYLYSAAATIVPTIHDGRALYYAAAGSTVTLVLLGEYIERFVRRRACAEIGDVTAVRRALSPSTAIEDVADRISAAIVPAAVVIAALTFVGWMVLGPSPTLVHAIGATVAVLVIACPAAIALASPLAFLMAATSAKRDGVHLRDPKLTETLARVTTLVLDRTGVLTEGTPVVRSVEPAPGFDQAELLRLAAAAEYESEHPIARAVVAHAKEDEDGPRSIRRPVAGRGVIADVRGRDVVLGAHALLSARGVDVPADALARAETLRRSGASVTFAGVDGRYAGLVALGDCAREHAREAIAELRRMGVRVAMMTGSSRTLGRSFARELDLHDAEVFAAIHPDDRARMIEGLRARGETVAVAGRHVASASAAHIGLAFGTSDHADVSLPQGDLHAIVRMIRLARRTVRNVRENVVLAILYNLLAIPVAAVTGVSPLVAACVMGLGTLSILGSSLRLLRTNRGT